MQITKLNKKAYHLEVEGAIINVREGLLDRFGRTVTEPNKYSGELVWRLLGYSNNRVVQLKNVKVG